MKFKIKTDREELREMFEKQNVTVSDGEFEAMFEVQTAMRTLHTMYVGLSDRAVITLEQFLELAEHNASLGFRGMKAVLGDQRYRAVFGLDETDNILPIDREVFLAQHATETA